MTNIDELINACKILSDYCNYSTNCGECLFSSACQKWSEGEYSDISHTMNGFKSILVLHKYKDDISNAYLSLKNICNSFDTCSECPFNEYEPCPKAAVDMVLDDINE